MSRIRSVHPGLFTDESFVSLTADAQVLLIGIWTEADDNGVFEWKPLTLRMKLRPTKDGDITGLMAEMVAVDCIKAFEVGGRKYGAVRNFRKYQRPKYPKAVHPLPDDLRAYVALSQSIGGIDVDEPDPFPQNGETAPQMEDGGGREEERDRVAREFEEFKLAYPKRDGSNPWKPAYDAFRRAVGKGVSADLIIGSARTYAAECDRKHLTSTDKVAQALTWLRQERYLDYAPSPGGAAVSDQFMASKGYAWDGGKWVKREDAA